MDKSIEYQPRYKLVPEQYLIEQFTEDDGWKPVVIGPESELVEIPSAHPYWKLILCERKVS